MESQKSSCSKSFPEPSTTGLSVLADPEKPTLDIVFVHGFKGHPVRTWTHKTETVLKDAEGGERPAKIPRLSSVTPHFKRNTDRELVYWPRHLIPTTLPTARVLVYGYDTNVRHSLGAPISKNTVYDISYDFLKSLEAERRSNPARPLVFVAHSLGGIVVKEVLRRSHGFETHHSHLRQIYESTAAILFFGTPHGGADPRGFLEHIAEQVVRAVGFTVNEQVVNTLLPTSERLRELRDEFAPMARQNDWIIYSFQEQYGVQLLNGKKVVEDVSSCIGDSSLEMTQYIANNHMDMCRFGGSQDVEYRKVSAALERIQKRIAERYGASASPETSLLLTEDHRQSLMQSLQYRAIDARYATIRTAHTRTCRWLLGKPEYQDWLDMNKTTVHHGFLWIRGKPGSGKSTLMKFAVGNARKAVSETVISFFFNARGEDLEKSTLGMYQSLLFQILKALPDLQTILDHVRPTILHEDMYRWNIDDLQILFEAAIKGLGQRRLTCFIDALDECEEGQIRELVAFLEVIGERATSSQVCFHVCLSSRHYPYISIRNGIQLTLEGQEGHDQDIARYLSSELKAGRGKQVEAIKEELLRRSSGIFLWVALVVQILNKEYDHGRVHSLWKRLREIPDGLDKLFEEILTRDQDNMEELVLCLQWILYAKRPLKREELYHAVLSGTDAEALSVSISENITAHDMERFILSCSKGLAETTKLEAQTVQFIHESVRDFLLGKNGLNKLKSELGLDVSHDHLKQCCYEYMASDTSEYLSTNAALPVAKSEEARRLRELVSRKFPFLEYAVRNVLHHADVANGEGISQEAFMENFTLGRWIMLDNLFEKYQVHRHTPFASLLYILAEKNLSNLIRTRVESSVFPGAMSELPEKERYPSLLHAALANVNVSKETVQALFSIPAARNHDSKGGCKEQSDCEIESNRAAIAFIIEKRPNLKKRENLMGWAASNGYETVVKFLLGRDVVDPESGHNGSSPLSLAAREGHTAVVESLLARDDIDPNSRNNMGRTPLILAVREGHAAVVKLLLARDDIDPNSNSRAHHSSPLSLAAEEGHTEIVKLLLARDDIDPNLCRYGASALSLAAKRGHIAIVQLLLAIDDVDLDSSRYADNPLLLAAREGHATVVKLLLARDSTRTDSKLGSLNTALLVAAERGHEAIVRLLLAEDDINPNSQTEYNQPPLSTATIEGHDAFVNVQARDDNYPNTRDIRGNTPLSSAVQLRLKTEVSLLLARDDIDPNIVDNDGRTPLYLAVCRGYEAIVKILLARDDIDPNIKNNWGQTPLSIAKLTGQKSMVKSLQAKINSDPRYKGECGPSSPA